MTRKKKKKSLKSNLDYVEPEVLFKITPPTEEEQTQIIKKQDACDIVAKYPGGFSKYLVDQYKAGKIKIVHKDEYPIPSLKNLGSKYPSLRPPCIEGIMRQGETMNVIASPKMGKSWLTGNLAMAFSAGMKWFEKFQVERGKVLIFDNELHAETIYYRYKLIGDALGVDQSIWETMIHVVPLRGKNVDIFALDRWLQTIKPGEYSMCILDSFYRFMPKGLNENDNASMTQLYNTIDQYAEKYQFSVTLIHHTSKGVQSNKSTTDVGSGAGAQSRAADVHLILRDHEEPGVIVIDTAVRSFEPVSPFCVRFQFPKFELAKSYDPEQLRGKDSGRGRPSKEREELDKVMKQKLLDAIHQPMSVDQMARLAESIGFKIGNTALKRLVLDWKEKNKLLIVVDGAGTRPTTFVNPEAKKPDDVGTTDVKNTTIVDSVGSVDSAGNTDSVTPEEDYVDPDQADDEPMEPPF